LTCTPTRKHYRRIDPDTTRESPSCVDLLPCPWANASQRSYWCSPRISAYRRGGLCGGFQSSPVNRRALCHPTLHRLASRAALRRESTRAETHLFNPDLTNHACASQWSSE